MQNPGLQNQSSQITEKDIAKWSQFPNNRKFEDYLILATRASERARLLTGVCQGRYLGEEPFFRLTFIES